jgi:hypothetical protein
VNFLKWGTLFHNFHNANVLLRWDTAAQNLVYQTVNCGVHSGLKLINMHRHSKNFQGFTQNPVKRGGEKEAKYEKTGQGRDKMRAETERLRVMGGNGGKD